MYKSIKKAKAIFVTFLATTDINFSLIFHFLTFSLEMNDLMFTHAQNIKKSSKYNIDNKIDVSYVIEKT